MNSRDRRKKESNYRLFLKLASEKRSVENLKCEVFLPERLTDPIELLFYPTKEQGRASFPFVFSIKGEIEGHSGDIMARIQADKVYNLHRLLKIRERI